jgi:hypothetical protein
VPLGFEQWRNLTPTPAAVPGAMNQQIGGHDRDNCNGNPTPQSQVMYPNHVCIDTFRLRL